MKRSPGASRLLAGILLVGVAGPWVPGTGSAPAWAQEGETGDTEEKPAESGEAEVAGTEPHLEEQAEGEEQTEEGTAEEQAGGEQPATPTPYSPPGVPFRRSAPGPPVTTPDGTESPDDSGFFPDPEVFHDPASLPGPIPPPPTVTPSYD
ncbi:MAG TPA: hypothetical protein VEI97_06675, partial [bacterium]|nr:hypothetical protein [bacterium]